MSTRSPSPYPVWSIEPVRIPSFLDDPDADVILRSSDGVEFRVFKVILSKSSPFFNDMFSLPQATGQSLTAAQVVDVAEDSTTLAKLLTYCYPLRTPEFSSLEEVIAFISAADKYQFPGAMERVKTELETYSTTQPVQLYTLACRYSLERLAAKACLSLTLDELTECEFNPPLLIRLHRYYIKCRTMLDTTITVTNVLSKLHESHMKTGENPSCYKPNVSPSLYWTNSCSSPPCQNGSDRAFTSVKLPEDKADRNDPFTARYRRSYSLYSRKWLSEFISKVHTELLIRPCPKSVFKESYIENALCIAAACPHCRDKACRYFGKFVSELADLVETEISKIPFI